MKRSRIIKGCFIGAAFCLMTLVFLAGCSTPVKIKTKEALFHVKIVDEIEYKQGYKAFGLSRCSSGVCTIQVREDAYPQCLTHEIRHVFEGDWHRGESIEDCY